MQPLGDDEEVEAAIAMTVCTKRAQILREATVEVMQKSPHRIATGQVSALSRI